MYCVHTVDHFQIPNHYYTNVLIPKSRVLHY